MSTTVLEHVTAKELPRLLKDLHFDPKQVLNIQISTVSPEETDTQETTKWERIAKRIQNDPDFDNPEFVKAWKHVKEDTKEVRENLSL